MRWLVSFFGRIASRLAFVGALFDLQRSTLQPASRGPLFLLFLEVPLEANAR